MKLVLVGWKIFLISNFIWCYIVESSPQNPEDYFLLATDWERAGTKKWVKKLKLPLFCQDIFMIH